MIGRTLAHYRIVDRVGAGGMAEVWRAVDTALGREVAIKVLPEAFATDPERRARFEREAKLLASLNHPGIATVHGLHAADGVHFLAMELVPGEDLAQRLARGRLPIETALAIAREITDALGAAHARGVIHRDLKPANIIITPEGHVKVLDFGLAKALDADTGTTSAPDQSPTMTSAGTVAGMILGTAAYMSPEQARGRPADRRADIWAFGCVLYEMLAGSTPFEGSTVSDTLAAILRAEPDWTALPAGVPPAARRLLRRCLEKNSDHRLHDILDARLEIDEARAGDKDAALAPPARRGAGRLIPWGIAAVLAAVTVATLVAPGRRRAPQSSDRLHVAIVLPQNLDLVDAGGLGVLAISPDVKRLVFAARRDDTVRLYLRALDSPDVVEMPGTEGASTPFFSPDGHWVGFFSGSSLKKIAVQGGVPVVLCEAPSPRGATWITDDAIVFAPTYTSGLAVVSAAGGEPKAVTTPNAARNERTHRWPMALPGGKSVLFTIGTLDKPGDYEDAVIAVADLASGAIHPLAEGASMAWFAPPGDLIYSREGTLVAVPFDAGGVRTTGSPTTILKGIAGDRTSGLVNCALAADGTLAYVPGATLGSTGTLAWVDRNGRVEAVPAEPALYRNLRLSPDGKRLALNIGEGAGDSDAWIYDFDRNALTRLTFDKSTFRPSWTPDGKRLVYASTSGGKEGIAWKAADGSQESQLFFRQTGIYASAPEEWVPGRSELVFTRLGGKGGADLMSIVPGETESKPVLDGPHAEGGATFSPDGKWMAYCSDESGQLEVYVRPYPGPGGKWQISTNGGRGPCWSRDGHEVFYTLGQKMMVVAVTTTPTFSPSSPRQLFEFQFENLIGTERDYDVSPDGRRFVFVRPLRERRREIDLVLGFTRSMRSASTPR